MHSLLLLLLCVLPLLVLGGPVLKYSDVFVKATDNYQCFRVPSMLVTRKGTILALVEGRKDTVTPVTCSSDGGETSKDTVLRRSTDGGVTWGPLQVIDSFKCGGGIECGYPSVVQDSTTGAIFVFYGGTSIFMSTSVDEGATWTTRVALSLPSAFHSASPGHGIQIDASLCGKQGPECPAGRLLLPMWCNVASVLYSCSIFSDDHGKTWKAGFIDTPQPTSRENQFAQLLSTSGARIYSTSRNFGPTHGTRFVSESENGGTNFTNFRQDKNLLEPVNSAWTGIVAGLQTLTSSPGRLLFSDPNCATARQNMTIKMSLDSGATWSKERVLDPGPSAYSALAKLSDTRAAILYERGDTLEYYEKITFVALDLSWIEG